jgi:uncharacterized membrane protein
MAMEYILNDVIDIFEDHGRDALEILNRHSGWIVWNLFLAFIPLVLSFWLYRRKTLSRSWVWWLAFIVFMAFLPNAPYLLTDIIHLLRATRAGYSVWLIAVVFIPLHVVAILGGIEAYVMAVINQSYYLRRLGQKRWVLFSELITHWLCAIGVYLGRFLRFNSWDLVTQPDEVIIRTLNELTSKRPAFVMLILFVLITVVYWILKQITLGLILRYRYFRLGKEVLE